MSEYVAHTESKSGLTLKIVLDNLGGIDSPLDGDESVIMAVLHHRYHNPAQDHGLTDEESIAAFAKKNRAWTEFPLFMYDHSGTSYRPSRGGNPFFCSWDSGRVGSFFIKGKDFLGKNPKQKDGTYKYGEKFYPDRESALFAAAEIICEEYTSWANGEIFGYVVEDENGDHLDSCWGFIGDPNGYVLEQGRDALKYRAERRDTEQARSTARMLGMNP